MELEGRGKGEGGGGRRRELVPLDYKSNNPKIVEFKGLNKIRGKIFRVLF